MNIQQFLSFSSWFAFRAIFCISATIVLFFKKNALIVKYDDFCFAVSEFMVQKIFDFLHIR